ncbi:MAG: glycosyltransferase family 2 protein [Candidatus Saccharibacteria bacterium]|nr:glycosyltransferase family 2 protein [Candidatus Saccharibacteria bacterium]
MKLIVVSICKDEAETIGQLLDQIPKNIPGVTKIEKWVIDDGSTDDTSDIAKKHGAHVAGSGMSKKLAFRFREAIDIALARDADILVNIDGDLQFSPSDIPKLVALIVEGEADFVAADRFTNPETGRAEQPKNMPAGKYWGNKAGAWVTSKLSGQTFNDVTCGFRAYNRHALISLNINGTHTYTQESFQVLAMKRMRIVAMPVVVKYFPGRKSRVVTSIPGYIATSAINILRSYRDFAPLRFFGWLGFVPALVAVPCLIFTVVHWINTGDISPYKFVGFLGVYMITLSLVVWAIGLLADMQVRLLNNQEKIYENLKALKWPEKK